MDWGEIVDDHIESSMDHSERWIDSTEAAESIQRASDRCNERLIDSRRGGDYVQDHSQETEEKHSDHSDDKSGSEQQNGRQHVWHEGTRYDRKITGVKELNNAIKLNKLSQVEFIVLAMKDPGSALADALASVKMSALKYLQTQIGFGLGYNNGEAVGNALTSGTFPCLTIINFSRSSIDSNGIQALGRAIGSGNLEKLENLNLTDNTINDFGMATLAAAFQHGEASVLPNLRHLRLSQNLFTETGLQSLVEVLISGRLDSLESLDVKCFILLKPTKESANALLSAYPLNNCLTASVDFDWHRFPDWERRYEQLRRRNLKNKDILAGLLHSPMVPAAFGKVFLCGSPMVGKTTLSHTLQRRFWRALFIWQTKPHVEKCTKGIAVSHFSTKGTKLGTKQVENPITLLLWDMAGQQDYHLVHNAFFPDLSFSEGKATTFVIVCNLRSLNETEQQLEYWLQYVASSCHKATPRPWHVFVVLNKLGGAKEVHGYAQRWVRVLEDQRLKFNAFLNVHTDSFVLDVRRRRKVIGFKKCLLAPSKSLLHSEKVHDICQTIQLNLIAWSERKKEFPVLSWKEYLKQVQQSILPWPEDIIEAVTKYLKETEC